MADVKDHVSGRGGNAGAQRYFSDFADGTYGEAVAARLFIKSGGLWIEWNGVTSGTVTTSESPPTSITTGKTTVTTAGTRVQLATNTAKSITIKALAANTGTIYVGNSGVTSANGFQLAAGDTVSLDISNSNVVYIDSSVNGEGVSWLMVN